MGAGIALVKADLKVGPYGTKTGDRYARNTDLD